METAKYTRRCSKCGANWSCAPSGRVWSYDFNGIHWYSKHCPSCGGKLEPVDLEEAKVQVREAKDAD